jgi:hypothetical protein
MTVDRDALWRSRTRILAAALMVLGGGASAVSCKGRDEAGKASDAGKASGVAKAEPVALQVGGLPVT